MAHPITAAIEAVKLHISNHLKVDPEVEAMEKQLRKDLSVMKKEDLIDMIVNLKLKKGGKVVQADLVADILCDPVCAILTYEEISECILENMQTDQKYSVDNLRWYKSNLQNQKGLPILNRMPAKERAAIDRAFIKSLQG